MKRSFGASLAVLPAPIWALGLTSLFMDMSSEMIHALLPVYLTGVLGISIASIGWIEGIAEATAMAVKVFSGAVSDWWGQRKSLTIFGYGLAALTKPLFPLAGGAGLVIAARFMDRVGKGIRGAPRDALIADLTPPDLRGAAYGLRQSLDTLGAVAGPLIGTGLMLWLNDFRTVFWIAVIPAFAAVGVLAFGVPERRFVRGPVKWPFSRAALRQLPGAFWLVTLLGALLSLARVSEAFLILRATGAGLAPAYAPLVLIFMSLVYAALAYPAGALADRMPRRRLLAVAIAALAASEFVLGLNANLWMVFAGIGLWGLHLALSQGLLNVLVAQTCPESLRGTAFGLFNLAGAVALLAGNAVFGALWSNSGAAFAYNVAAMVSLSAFIVLVWLNDEKM